MKMELVIDGDEFGYDFFEKWGLLKYCNIKNNKGKINFVGIVMKNKEILFSFPKFFSIPKKESEILNSINNILMLLEITQSTVGSFDKGIKENFPLKAYLEIVFYFKRRGIYVKEVIGNSKGYKGQISWKKTIERSNKIISKSGIIFTPFIIKGKNEKKVFISRCMEFILSDVNENYKKIITHTFPYNSNKCIDKEVLGFDKTIGKLKKIKAYSFKDTEKELINNLIEYFRWKSTSKKNIHMITFNFERYWQSMIELYLNHNFKEYDSSRELIIWEDDCNKGWNFKTSSKKYFESDSMRVQLESKEPDRKHHYYIFDHVSKVIDKQIVLLDSKYYKQTNGIEYKQLVYNYVLKEEMKNYMNKKNFIDEIDIINGLILPTNKKYYSSIHIDRSDLDGIKIVKHYVNLNQVIDFIIRYKDEYKISVTKKY